MSERRKRIVSWTLCLVWTGLGLTAAVTFYLVSGAKAPLGYLASLVLAGGLTGWSAGRLLEGASERIGPLMIGALSGHVAFVPPAIQLGQWVAGLAVQTAAVHYASGSLVLYAVAFAAVAVAVLSVGSVAGMALQVVCRFVLRKFRPELLAPSRSLPRPRWRTIRIAMLTVILAGVLIYADGKGALPWLEAKPPTISDWIEYEKSLFRSILARQRYDVLVLPVQVDGPSFDGIARSLMTRYLASRVTERTGQRLPDPTLLARALDVRARQIDLGDALRLAEQLGIRIVFVSQVRRTGETFRFHTRTWTRTGEKAPWREDRAATLERLRFHDRLPPSVTFRESVDALLDKLQLGTAPVATPQAAQTASAPPPIEDLLKLASRGEAPAAEHALHLQLLASLHVRGSIEAQVLWERSLIALRGVPHSSSLYRVLEARAYLHLARRPHALETLGKPDSPAERALYAVLNADVPGVESVVDSIKNRALRLITELELADLYQAFGLKARHIDRRKKLLERAWTDAAALKFRLSFPEWFTNEVHGQVAAALARLGPIKRDLRESAAAWLHWL